MRPHRLTSFTVLIAAVALVAPASLALVPAAGPAVAAVPQTPSFSVRGVLAGVAAVSARQAWAGGSTVSDAARPILAAWNGTAWRRVRVPVGVGSGQLSAVAAASGGAA
jgi:hypothetical protein